MLRRTALAVLLTVPLLAQEVGRLPSSHPPVFALTNATVVVGNGQIIEGATVVLRDGLIESVGRGAAVPPLAWEIDLSGMQVYPGLIDALTEVGLRPRPDGARSRPATPDQPTGAGRQPGAENQEGPGLFSHVQAGDRLDADVEKLRSWRDAGVTTLNVTPDEGIFRGQTAVVNLNGDDPDRMIVRSPVAMSLSFQSMGFRTYPGSLMGVIAHIKQTLHDARHYGIAMATYTENPRGLKRPETDRALAALQPVLAGTMPVVFPAKQAREVARVMEILHGFDAPCVIAGGFEAHHLADALKEKNIPVLVSLNFPERDPKGNPHAEDPMRVIRYRQEAPRAAARLQEAGVRFAFYSDGLKSGREFLENLRKAVREGLDREAAIHAATLAAARVLGVGEQLGSIEAGKIANLVVADGDLFEEGTRIRHVFVDGEKYDVPQREQPAEAAGEGEAPTRGTRIPQGF